MPPNVQPHERPGKAPYPAQNGYDEQMMKVSDIHTIRYWQCGNPQGKPGE